MTPILFRVGTAIALGSGTLIASSEVGDYILPASIALLAIIVFILASIWHVYQSSNRN
jgi:hypothetical protein